VVESKLAAVFLAWGCYLFRGGGGILHDLLAAGAQRSGMMASGAVADPTFIVVLWRSMIHSICQSGEGQDSRNNEN
jgi:hypothetical protein